MGLNNPSAGFQNSQEYVSSGLPYVVNTTSSIHVEFPNITRSFTVTASGSNAHVYFSGSAPANRKFTILAGTTVDFPLRIKELWIDASGSASLCASLTLISSNKMPTLDSSTWSGI